MESIETFKDDDGGGRNKNIKVQLFLRDIANIYFLFLFFY